MQAIDEVTVDIPGKGQYENCLEEGQEQEWLNGVGLKEGHYCKHYRRARDWSDKKNLDRNGVPCLQNYCGKTNSFIGWTYCCGAGAKCFEKGKSAGVQRIRNRIRKKRLLGEG